LMCSVIFLIKFLVIYICNTSRGSAPYAAALVAIKLALHYIQKNFHQNLLFLPTVCSTIN